MPGNAEFSRIFHTLRAMIAAHADRLKITKDSAAGISADMLHLRYKGKPVFFGGVRMGKNYVSFHFMPVYMNPQLQQTISPELRKRMQGKACFNFKTADEKLFAQLAELTAAGLDYLEQGTLALPGFERVEAPKS